MAAFATAATAATSAATPTMHLGDDIVVVIKTSSPAALDDRLLNSLTTWGRHVQHLLMVSDTDAPPPIEGRPAVANGVTIWAGLLASAPNPPKFLSAEWGPGGWLGRGGWGRSFGELIQCVHAWRMRPHRKWYVLVDDDTFVNTAELASALRARDPTQRLYLGAVHNAVVHGHCHGHTNFPFNRGGPGIILSGAALKALMRVAGRCAAEYGNCVYSDAGLALCMKHLLGIDAQHVVGMCDDSPFSYLRPGVGGCTPDRWDVNWATCRATSPFTPRVGLTFHKVMNEAQMSTLERYAQLGPWSPFRTKLDVFLAGEAQQQRGGVDGNHHHRNESRLLELFGHSAYLWLRWKNERTCNRSLEVALKRTRKFQRQPAPWASFNRPFQQQTPTIGFGGGRAGTRAAAGGGGGGGEVSHSFMSQGQLANHVRGGGTGRAHGAAVPPPGTFPINMFPKTATVGGEPRVPDTEQDEQHRDEADTAQRRRERMPRGLAKHQGGQD